MKWKKLNELTLRELALENGWKGQGTENNPLLIESFEDLTQDYYIYNSSLHIHIRNCHFNRVKFKNCSNIFLENSKFYSLMFSGCTKSNIINSSLFTLSLAQCNSLNSESLSIGIFHMSGCFNNSFKNSSFGRITMLFSKNNSFDNIEFLAKYKKTLIRGTTNIFLILPGVVFLLGISSTLYWILIQILSGQLSIDLTLSIIVLFFMLSMFTFFITMLLRNVVKTKGLAPNKITNT